VLFAATDREPQTAVEEPSAVARQLGGRTVLLVDDSEEVREITATMLRRVGHTVIATATGEEGLDVFNDQAASIDLVILDMRMPGMGGAETCRRLRVADGDVPIILASGYGIQEEIAELVVDPRTSFLQKPYGLTTLLEAMEMQLASETS